MEQPACPRDRGSADGEVGAPPRFAPVWRATACPTGGHRRERPASSCWQPAAASAALQRQPAVRVHHRRPDRDAVRTRPGARRRAAGAQRGIAIERGVQPHALPLPAVVARVHAVAQHVVDRQALGARVAGRGRSAAGSSRRARARRSARARRRPRRAATCPTRPGTRRRAVASKNETTRHDTFGIRQHPAERGLRVRRGVVAEARPGRRAARPSASSSRRCRRRAASPSPGCARTSATSRSGRRAS